LQASARTQVDQNTMAGDVTDAALFLARLVDVISGVVLDVAGGSVLV
jgi:hypothetical protein